MVAAASQRPSRRRYAVGLLCVVLAGCGSRCGSASDFADAGAGGGDVAPPATESSDDAEEEVDTVPLQEEAAGDDDPVDPGGESSMDTAEPDESGRRCVDVADGAGWWSVTEKIGLVPNLHWGYVRDLNPEAQVQGEPDQVQRGATVCLDDDEFANPTSIEVPEEEVDPDCAPHVCVTYSSVADSGGADELTAELPELATVAEAAVDDGSGLDTDIDIGDVQPTLVTLPPVEFELPELDTRAFPAIDANANEFSMLYTDEAWEQILARYDERYAGSSITFVGIAAIVSIADLVVHGVPNETALAHYEGQYERLASDVSSDDERDLLTVLCAGLPTCEGER